MCRTKRKKVSSEEELEQESNQEEEAEKSGKEEAEQSGHEKPKKKKTRTTKNDKPAPQTGKVTLKGNSVSCDDHLDEKKQKEEFAKETKTIEEWKAKWFWKRVELNPKDVIKPKPEILIRDPNPDHVTELMQSFLRTHTKNPNVSVVALGYKGPKLLPNLIAAGLQAWEGLHSTMALQKIQAVFTENAFWQTYNADVYICPDNAENRRMLRLLGNLSNFKSSVVLKQDFVQLLKMQHDQTVAERARLGLGEDEDLPDDLVASMKKDWVFSTGQSMSTIQAIWNISKYRGPIWDRIYKIVSGKLDNPVRAKRVGFRAPRSCHHFNFMFGIEDETLIELLDEVIKGESNTNTFMNKCIKVRAIKKIRRTILDWIARSEKIAPDLKTDDWNVAVERFKHLTSDDFVSVWEQTFAGLKEKEVAPANFFVLLEQRYKVDHIQLEGVTSHNIMTR